jgi:DHA2 family multidrug resistance protein
VFGVAVVVAPTLGGWLSDNLSWQWVFLINVPVGLFAMAAIALVLPGPRTARAESGSQQDYKFDVVGFILVATFLGALEVVLDRGLEDDWFGSSFIVTFAVISALAFVLMIPWEMRHHNPAVDLRMIASRQFGASFLSCSQPAPSCSGPRNSYRNWCSKISATPRPGPASCSRPAASLRC